MDNTQEAMREEFEALNPNLDYSKAKDAWDQDSNNTSRSMYRLFWSMFVIIGGAFSIEKISIAYPQISSIALPIYFLVVLLVLYMGHLLIDALTTPRRAHITYKECKRYRDVMKGLRQSLKDEDES